MKALIISDVHANLTALEAVIEAAGDIEAVWCLGDLVGYGPDPNDCIDRICTLPNLTCLLGNHDAAALGQIDDDAFNLEARTSLRWMRSELTPSHMAFLRALPEMTTEEKLVTLVHGSPRNPVWEYVMDLRIARFNFEYFTTPFCFVGHTHLPVIYQYNADRKLLAYDIPLDGDKIELNAQSIINPGSVGQPRDHDPRAAYAIFDTETNICCFHRVDYDVTGVQKRILLAGLPVRHAYRLSEGW
ncbi:MAG TPA: metallophosphoesterase family protein [Anaerolineaceae bacterium]|nr:metallophosphoesterase family protein [Anaerolineaceae bacterium]HPN53898.1 metallophosphoesterase family protein [Anaerolineaceae bacterium]